MTTSGFLQRLVVSAGVTPPAASERTEPTPVVRRVVAPLYSPNPIERSTETTAPPPRDRAGTTPSSANALPAPAEHRGLLVEPAIDRSRPTESATDRRPQRRAVDESSFAPIRSLTPAAEKSATGRGRPDGDGLALVVDAAVGARPRSTDDESADRSAPSAVEVRHTREVIRPAEPNGIRHDERSPEPIPPSPSMVSARPTETLRPSERRGEHGGDDRVVHVTIGRVEIRTAAPSTRQLNGHHRPGPTVAANPPLSALDQYLADRADRTGR